MKLTIDTATLAEALTWTVKAIAQKPAVPIMSGVQIGAEHGVVHLSASDYETSHRTSVTADIDTDGSVLVHGPRLAALVKSLKKGNATTLEVKGGQLLVQSGRSLFTLGLMAADEYPALPELPDIAGTVDGAELAQSIGQTAVAASTDDTIPVLGSLRFEAADGTLKIMSTDRYRLASKELPWDGADASFLARAKDLGGIDGAAGKVTVHASERLIGFTVGARATTVAQQDGDFPKIEKLFASSHEVEVTVDASEMVEAVQRASLVAERNTPIRCEFTADGAFLDAGTGEDAQSNEYVACQLDGEPITAAFNPSYLLDALKAADGDFARFRFVDAKKPALILGDGDDYRHLIMPIRLPELAK